MQRDDDGAKSLLGRIGIVEVSNRDVGQTEREKHRRATSWSGLQPRETGLHVSEQFIHLLRAVPELLLRYGIEVGAVGVAVEVLGQQAQQDALRRDHRLGGIAGIVAVQFSELGLEADRALKLGFAFRSGEVQDEGVQDRSRQWVNDALSCHRGPA